MKFKQSTFLEKFVQCALIWCALLLVLLLTTQARAGYLYALNDSPAGNTVYGFSVDETNGFLGRFRAVRWRPAAPVRAINFISTSI
jgi:hypothetical protein